MMWRSKDYHSAGLWWSLLSSGGCLGGYGRLLKSFQPLIVAFVSVGDAVDHSEAMANFLVFSALISSPSASAAAGAAAADHFVTEVAVDRWCLEHRAKRGGKNGAYETAIFPLFFEFISGSFLCGRLEFEDGCGDGCVEDEKEEEWVGLGCCGSS
uniref:Uncharacterized protein n=1 Tax=Fagus sylvatica TaxID=28930 RepID=A0A2N9FWG2_FAGSY